MNTEHFEVIDQLVAAHWRMRDTFGAHHEHLSPLAFAGEFQTVGVHLPRRSGKSTYIKLRASPVDAIVVPLTDLRRNYKGAVAEIFSPDDFARQVLSRLKFQRVYFDEPSMFREDIHALLSPFAGRAQQFILIGTP